MGAAYSLNVELESPGPCFRCGVVWMMPASLVRQCRDNGASFYCPNGHGAVFRESEVERLKKQLEAEKKRTAWAEENGKNLREQLLAEEQKTARVKRKLGRVGKGVCPCCNRSFQNVRRHMETKHPKFDGEVPTEKP